MTRRCARSMPMPGAASSTLMCVDGGDRHGVAVGVDHKDLAARGQCDRLAQMSWHHVDVSTLGLQLAAASSASSRSVAASHASSLACRSRRSCVCVLSSSCSCCFACVAVDVRRRELPLRSSARSRSSSRDVASRSRATSARSGLRRLRRSASSRLRCFFCSALEFGCDAPSPRRRASRVEEPAGVVVEVAVERRRAAAVDEDQLVRDRAQQMPIVRDEHDRAFVVLQRHRQRLAHLEVEMVGRLVEQQQVRAQVS